MKIYLVGGAVRDKLLQLPITDKDWVVVGATPKELLDQGFRQVGNDFPVFLHPKTGEEYALARTERKSGLGHTGFICNFSPSITLEEDLIRRDLTINAMAETVEGKIIDPYHGITDLKHRQLRHVSPAFREDPLRVLRVARFAARFYPLGFSIAPETMQLMKKMVANGEINHLTPERIWQETEKALQSDAPEVYFNVLQESGVLPILFPEISLLFTPPNSNTAAYLYALQHCATLTKNPLSRFALLFQGVQNLKTSDNNPYRNERTQIRQFCSRLKVPTRYRTAALMVHKHHDAILRLAVLSPKEILHIFDAIDVWRHPEHLEQLLISTEAIFKSHSNQNNALFRQAALARKLYQAANSVNSKDIIAEGYLVGIEIKNELKLRRIKAITEIQSRGSKQ